MIYLRFIYSRREYMRITRQTRRQRVRSDPCHPPHTHRLTRLYLYRHLKKDLKETMPSSPTLAMVTVRSLQIMSHSRPCMRCNTRFSPSLQLLIIYLPRDIHSLLLLMTHTAGPFPLLLLKKSGMNGLPNGQTKVPLPRHTL